VSLEISTVLVQIQLLLIIRGCSSFGRAVALQAKGSRFDPDLLHQFLCGGINIENNYQGLV
jgi:hypothetical protein